MNRSQQSSKPEQKSAPAQRQPAEARAGSRDITKLQTIVQIKDATGGASREITDVTTVSKNGAGFSLVSPCAVGSLVTLVLPMPAELRVYDEDERLYPVMGLVQYCNEGILDGEKCYHVGVAFIGKEVPESFKENPLQSYRITGMSKTGLWTIAETETDFKARRHPRYWVNLDVTISLLQKEKKAVSKEDAVTQNIGAKGASVKCSLGANVKDKVKVACKEYNFYTVAVVKNRKIKAGQQSTLHLEFLENEFPIEKLLASMNRLAPSGEGNGTSEPGTAPSLDEPGAFEVERFLG